MQLFPILKFSDFFPKVLIFGGGGERQPTFWKNSMLYASYCEFAGFFQFRLNQVSFKKTQVFNKKVLYVFEKSYHFIYILWHIWYNLDNSVMKTFQIGIRVICKLTFKKRTRREYDFPQYYKYDGKLLLVSN